jgi:hypothetical protein
MSKNIMVAIVEIFMEECNILFRLNWVGRSGFYLDWTMGIRSLLGVFMGLGKKVDDDWPIVAKSLKAI